MSRSEAYARAGAILDLLDADLRDRGLSLGPTRATVVGGLRSLLTQRVADQLQGSARRSPAVMLREVAYGARERGRDLWMAPRLRWPKVKRRAEKLALFVPRRPGHLRDLEPVARLATETGAFDVGWLVFRPEHAARVSPSVYGPAAVPLAELMAVPRAVALERAMRRWRADLDRDVWRVIAEEVALGLPSVMRAAHALARSIDHFRPASIVVSNPYSMEGAIAGALAAERGVKLVALQHGEIAAGYGEWSTARFDRITVWGEAVRDRLRKLGVADARIVVTGAPWADALAIGERAPKTGPASIVVALSGAGHAVGLEEHLAHIELIVAAAAMTPQHQWVFRLHPKDDPARWARALAARPAPNAALSHGPDVPPIHDVLAQASALVTVTSATALDAMLHQVPVVTLGRGSGEPLSGFVEAGATMHVAVGEALAPVIDRLVERGPEREIEGRARTYVSAYFGPRDGRAAERVVEAIRSA